MVIPSSKCYSSGKRAEQILYPVAKGACLIPIDAIVDPLPHLLALDQPRFPHQPQVMRDRGLLYRHRRFEITDADTTFVASEDVEQLQPHGVGELLKLSRQLRRVRVGARGAGADIAAALP